MNTTIHTDTAGLALQGHDTVAYFTLGTPTKGNPNISREWRGATWLFSTAEHRDLFDADPHKYAPAFGGHCAVAQVMGQQLRGSPKRWRIEGGQLFINKNLMASVMFRPFANRIRRLAERSHDTTKPGSGS
ncbi:MAG: YHS domain-containing (seleno)protein [Ilumatobacter sp.]